MRTLLLLPLLILPIAGCSGEARTPDPAPLVRVVEVGDSASAMSGDTLTGTVAARVETVLAFREGGRILARAVDNGQTVTANAVLARIDPADLGDALSAARMQAVAARSAIDGARASARRADADEQRLRGLAESGAISRRDYDAALEAAQTTRARVATAEADAAAADANARIQSNRRGYAELRAPSAGVVTAVLAEPGQVVAPGTPVLRLAEAGPREVVVEIPEQMQGNVARTATGTLYGGGEFSLTLRELAASADPITRTYRARYQIMGSSPPLGATVTLRFARQGQEHATQIPIGAVTERGGRPGVWSVGADGKVVWRVVTLVMMDGERVSVLGLRSGDRIVALGAHLLQPGQAVRVARLSAAEAR